MREVYGAWRPGRGGHVAVTCRFLGDVEVHGSAGRFTVTSVSMHTKNCGGTERTAEVKRAASRIAAQGRGDGGL